MSLPVPAVDFDDPEEKEAYDEFVELVEEATSDDEQIDKDLDWEIECAALDLYEVPEEKRPRI